VTLSQLDSDKYFMCNIDDFKFLADMIEHVPLQLRVRYVFCCAPIPKKQPFVCAMFLKVWTFSVAATVLVNLQWSANWSLMILKLSFRFVHVVWSIYFSLE